MGRRSSGARRTATPPFFRHRFGKGMVYLLNFPLEAAAANTIGGFETDAWKLYREILHPRRLAESPSTVPSAHRTPFRRRAHRAHRGHNQPEPFKGALGSARGAAVAGPALRTAAQRGAPARWRCRRIRDCFCCSARAFYSGSGRRGELLFVEKVVFVVSVA